MLQIATDILEAKDRKSKAKFGFVPPLPQHYSMEALRMMYQVEQATGKVILNPFCLDVRSLSDVDEDFLTDRNTLYEWLDFAEENAKAGEQFKQMTGQT